MPESHEPVLVNTIEYDKLMQEIVEQSTHMVEYFQLNFIYHLLISGHGLEFDRVRQYMHGDDPRQIDWRIFARQKELFTKAYKEERQYDIIIVVDVSDSMLLGTTEYTKNEYAAIVAGILSYAATEASDQVAVALFSDRVNVATDPENDYSKIVHYMSKKENYGGKTSWAKLINLLMGSYNEESVIFIISDYIDFEPDEVLPELSAHFAKIYGIMIRDPADVRLPENVGGMYLKHLDNSKAHLVDLKQAQTEYETLAKQEIKKVKDAFHDYDQLFFEITTDTDFGPAFVQSVGAEKGDRIITFKVWDLTVNIYNPLENFVLLALLIMLTVGAYFFMIHARGKRATYFGNLKTLERVQGFKRYHVSSIVLVTKVFVISLLYLTATDAIEIREVKPVSDTDYVILIDSSSSMAKTDYNPNRLAAAKDISKRWLSTVPNGTRVGLIAFSQDLSTVVQPTLSISRVNGEIDNIDINYAKSGTSLVYALSSAVSLLNSTVKKRSILLLTDGTEEIDESTIAFAREENVRIFAFGIGTDEEDIIIDDEDIPEELREAYSSLEFNFSKLEQLAEKTDGEAYQVSNSLELEEAFEEVTLENIDIELNSSYYVVLLIAILSILELVVYSKFGGL